MKGREEKSLTDLELNEAVARKLGLEIYPQTFIPPYSTSMAAAWEILDHHGDWDMRRQNRGYFKCILYLPSEEYEAEADTAPMAICQAFLKLP